MVMLVIETIRWLKELVRWPMQSMFVWGLYQVISSRILSMFSRRSGPLASSNFFIRKNVRIQQMFNCIILDLVQFLFNMFNTSIESLLYFILIID